MVHCRHEDNRGNPCKEEMCPRFTYDFFPENYEPCSYKSDYKKGKYENKIY